MSEPVPRLVHIDVSGGITLESKCDLAKWTIRELTRRAMLDVGRYIIQNVRSNVQTIFPYTIGARGKKGHRRSERYQYWVPKKENYLVLGIENQKKGAVTAWWADQLEMDAFVVPPKGIRKKTKKPFPFEAQCRAATKHRRLVNFIPTSHIPRRHLLEKFTKTHIHYIVDIESQYLQTINNESAAVALARAIEEMEVLRGDES